MLFVTTVVSVTGQNAEIESAGKVDNSRNVFAELCSSTNCKFCKFANAALKNIYDEENYPFYYLTLVSDNSKTFERLLFEYNVRGIPIVYFDGGYQINIGAADTDSAKEEYEESIQKTLNRVAPDIDITLSVEWTSTAILDVDVTVTNNEPTQYDGHIRVYITEKSSTLWRDTFDVSYKFAFLDYALNEDISINQADTWAKSTTWDGNQDFGYITRDNIMVFAVVFNSEKHQGYSSPPYGNPFDAYYADNAISAVTAVPSNPPAKPMLNGPTSGETGETYTYSAASSDPDGDDIYYWFDWGDTENTGWLGPYASGEIVEKSHSWDLKGVFDVTVKTKDIHDVGSECSSLKMSTPRFKSGLISSILDLMKQFFPIISKIFSI